jgi:hypothetical protein
VDVTVGFQQCHHELLDRAKGNALAAYHEWLRRPGTHDPEYAAVIPFVQGFTHKYLFEIRVQDIRNMMERSAHALGDVESHERLPEIEDFGRTSPWAFQHLFHKYIESHCEIPTWQKFRLWLFSDCPFYVDRLKAHVHWGEADEQRHRRLQRAGQWRIGKFYYSAVREIDMLVRLREQYNIELKYHLLADVLFRVDFWCASTLVRVYFENEEYMSEMSGRKRPAGFYFSDARPPFKTVTVLVERQGFGKFWLATDKALQDLAAMI